MLDPLCVSMMKITLTPTVTQGSKTLAV